jgi:hypothetical protein
LAGLLRPAPASASSSCSIYWTGRVNGTWATPGNWSATPTGTSAGRLPGPSDLVCAVSAPARRTATSSGAVTVGGIVWSAASAPALVVSSGTFTIGGSSGSGTSSLAALTIRGGTFGGPAKVDVSKLAVSGGTLSGRGSLVLGVGHSGTIGGPASSNVNLANGFSLIDQGTVSVASGSGALTRVTFAGAATLQNDGALDLGDGANLHPLDASATAIVNEPGATLSYSGTSGATVGVDLTNGGAVLAGGGGTLTVGPSGPTADGGTYDAGAGSMIDFTSSRTLVATPAWSGAGTLMIDVGATLTAPPLVVGGLDVQGGTLDAGARVTGTLQLSGATVGAGTTLTVAPAAVGTISATAGVTLTAGATLVNDGALTAASGTSGTGAVKIELAQASTITNYGNLTLGDGADLLAADSSAVSLQNEPGGTIAYAGSSAATIAVPFTNDGTTSAAGSGTLAVGAAGPGPDPGTYAGASGSTIDFEASRTLGPTATWTGPGTMAVSGGATVTAPSLTLGGLTVLGSTFAGSATVTGQLVLKSATFDGGTLTLAPGGTGSVLAAGGVGLDLGGGADLVNQGTLELADYAGVAAPGSPGSTFVNTTTGVIDYAGSVETTISPPFTNAGNVVVGSGTLKVGAPGASPDTGGYAVAAAGTVEFQQSRVLQGTFGGAGTLRIDPTVTVTAGSALTVGGLSVQSGTIVDTTTVTVTADLVLSGAQLSGGAFTLGPGAQGSIGSPQGVRSVVTLAPGASLTNEGTLAVDDNALLTTAGNPAAAVVNAAGGTITDTGAATATIGAPFANDGTVDVGGTAVLAIGPPGAGADTGSYGGSAGATVEFVQSRSLTGPNPFSGGATLLVGTGAALSTLSPISPGGLSVTGGTFSGTATVSASLYLQAATLTHATVTLAAGGTGVIDQLDGAGESLVTATLTNDGTLTTTTDSGSGFSDVVTLSGASQVDNAGTLALTDAAVVASLGSGGGSVFNAAGGTLTYEGTTTAALELPFTNSGTVSVGGSGTLLLYQGGLVADKGLYGATTGATIELVRARTFATSAQWSGSGTLEIGPSGSLGAPAPLQIANLSLQGGTFAGSATVTGRATLAEGVLSGPGTLTIPAGASGVLGADQGISLSFTNGYQLVNDGALTTAQTPGAFTFVGFANSSSLSNQGSLTLSDNASFVALDGTADAFTNTASGTVTYGGSATATIVVPFANAGAVSLTAGGTLEVGRGGPSADTGTYSVAAAATLDVVGARDLGPSAVYTGPGTLEIGGGGDLASASVLSPTTLSLTGGTLAATATVSGGCTLGAGGLAGPGSLTLPAGQTDVLGESGATLTLSDGYAIDNAGTLDVASGATVDFTGASGLDNRGTIALADGAALGAADSSANLVTNEAGALVTDAASSTSATISVPFVNLGTTQVGGTGTLVTGPGPGADTGTFSVAPGATFDVDGARTLGAGAVLGGGGTLEIGPDGALTDGQPLTLPSLELAGGSLSASAAVTGTADLAGGVLTGGGVLTVEPGAVGTIGGLAGTPLTLEDGYTLVNQGALQSTAPSEVALAGSSVLENASQLGLVDGATVSALDGTADALINEATGSLSYAGAGAAALTAPFLNLGSVSTTGTATLSLGSDGTPDSGAYQAGTGTTIDVVGTRTLGPGSTFGGGGTLAIGTGGALTTTNPLTLGALTLDGGTLTATADVTGDLQLTSGTLVGPGVVTLAAGGSGTLGGAAGGAVDLAHGVQLVNDATMTTVAGAGALTVQLSGAARFENAGDLIMADSATIGAGDATSNLMLNDATGVVSYTGHQASAVDVAYTNDGDTTVTGTGTLTLASLDNLAAGVLTGGTFDVESGVLAVPGPVTDNAASLTLGSKGALQAGGASALIGLALNTGSISVSGTRSVAANLTNEGALAVTSGVLDVRNFTQTAGTTSIAAGATLEVGTTGTRPASVDGGTVTGNGTLECSSVSGGGTIVPGSAPGPLHLTGAYAPGATGKLRVAISGPPVPGTGFGQLSVAGTATLAGTLSLSTAPGFTPVVGSSYEVLTAAGVVGTFTQVVGTGIPGGHTYAVSYTATGVYVRVS